MKDYNKQNIPLAQALRQDQTKWEKHLWYDFLKTYPIKFQRQKAIDNFIVDFYCAKAKLVIELDGYYHTTEMQYKEDKARTKRLNEVGLTVIRFTNKEIDTEFEKCCKIIDDAVKRNWG